jgi:hypothetical protein
MIFLYWGQFHNDFISNDPGKSIQSLEILYNMRIEPENSVLFLEEFLGAMGAEQLLAFLHS